MKGRDWSRIRRVGTRTGRSAFAIARTLGRRPPATVLVILVVGLALTAWLAGDPRGGRVALASVAVPAMDTLTPAERRAFECLALNVYWEARSEPIEGQVAIAAVTLNRVAHPAFPDSVCAVIRQGGEGRRHRCQFSWWCDGKADKPRERTAWETARQVAAAVLIHRWADPTDGALWYHADYVEPSWALGKSPVTQIGRHIYYVEADTWRPTAAAVSRPLVGKKGGLSPFFGPLLAGLPHRLETYSRAWLQARDVLVTIGTIVSKNSRSGGPSMTRKMSPISGLVFGGLLLAGCASDPAARSGFLGDYSRFGPHPSVEGALYYEDAAANLKSYNGFIIDPVLVHFAPNASGTAIDPETLSELTTYFRGRITEKLQPNYNVVSTPGTGVARIRVAITDIDETVPALNLHPATKLSGIGLGGASMEAEALDSLTNKRIVAVVDSQQGNRLSIGAGLDRYGHAKQVMESWAERFVANLDEIHGR